MTTDAPATGAAAAPRVRSAQCPGCSPRSSDDVLAVGPGWRLVLPADVEAVAGWLVIEPTRHVSDFTELSPAEVQGLTTIIATAVRLVTAAAGVACADHYVDGARAHLRWNVVPRRPGAPVGAALLIEGDTSAAVSVDATNEALRRERSTI